MPVSVTMPRLGESVTEGTVTRWLKQEGDQVSADEPLLEVSTDKVDTEVPSPASGILTSIKVAEDETVEIGVELAVISEEGEATGDSGPSESAAGQTEQADAETGEGSAAPAPQPDAQAEAQAETQPAAEQQGEQQQGEQQQGEQQPSAQQQAEQQQETQPQQAE